MFLSFFYRRSRRLVAYTISIGLGVFLMVLRQSADAVWRPLVWGFKNLLDAEGTSDTLTAIQIFLIADIAPFTIAICAMALLSFTAVFILALAVTLIIPIKFQAYLDGMIIMFAMVLMLEGLGISSIVRAALGAIPTIIFYWLILMSTSTLLWKHLPFGLRYTGTATRNIPVAIEALADRVVPGRAPTEDLADITLTNAPPKNEDDGNVFLRENAAATPDHLDFSLKITAAGPFVTSQEIRYRLSRETSNSTQLTIDIELGGMAPMSYWDFWTRDFARDYLDHLTARTTHTPDRSVYGWIQGKALRKAEKIRDKAQPA